MDKELCLEIKPFQVERIDQILQETDRSRIYFTLLSVTKRIDQALWQNRLENRCWWNTCFELLSSAVSYYGKENVGVHICLGLGETEEQIVQLIQSLKDQGVVTLVSPCISIEAFHTIVRDYPILKVSRGKFYRTLVANYVIEKGLSRLEQFTFNEFGQVIGFGISLDTLLKSAEWEEVFDPGNERSAKWAIGSFKQEFIKHLPLRSEWEDSSILMKEIFRMNWVEAWGTQNRMYTLEGIAFDEDEIEEEGNSFYKMVAELASGHESE